MKTAQKAFSSKISNVMKVQYLSHVEPDYDIMTKHVKERPGSAKTAAILEIHKQMYLGHFLTNLHQIWCAGKY